jgi:hypothetical protein
MLSGPSRSQGDSKGGREAAPSVAAAFVSGRPLPAQKSEIGLMLGPSEWLYRTFESAEKGLDFVMLMNAWWVAITRGYPAGDLP